MTLKLKTLAPRRIAWACSMHREIIRAELRCCLKCWIAVERRKVGAGGAYRQFPNANVQAA